MVGAKLDLISYGTVSTLKSTRWRYLRRRWHLPSFVTPAGVAIIPALLTKTSRRCDCEVNCLAASAMDAKEARSRFKNEILALGTAAVISLMASSALDGVRAAR